MTTKPHVIFYTRPGCHLCEEAMLEIAAADCADAYTFEMSHRRRPRPPATHTADIPVVVINASSSSSPLGTALHFKRALSGNFKGLLSRPVIIGNSTASGSERV